jgi:hypothetical protein
MMRSAKKPPPTQWWEIFRSSGILAASARSVFDRRVQARLGMLATMMQR